MKHRNLQILLLILCFILFFFPEASSEGAKNGLLLWSGTIVPTLLPFFLLTGIMNKYHAFYLVSYLFFLIYRRFPWLNRDLAYTLILGFFCGYPLGAKIINDLIGLGSYTKKEGQSLLAVCNNVSPMFTIGYTLTLILKDQLSIPFFFLCLYAPNACYFIYLMANAKKKKMFFDRKIKTSLLTQKTMDEIIFDSLRSIFSVGIYIMIFSIGANLLKILDPVPYLTDFMIGILEITTAVTHFGSMQIPLQTKAAILCAVSSFGGLSAMAQTMSVCRLGNLSFRKYLFTKTIFAILSFLLAWFLF